VPIRRRAGPVSERFSSLQGGFKTSCVATPKVKPSTSPQRKERTMNPIDSLYSGTTRLVCAFAACVIAVTLFSAVAVGLTGEPTSALFAQGGKASVQEPLRGA
jgi:hypothetical protein